LVTRGSLQNLNRRNRRIFRSWLFLSADFVDDADFKGKIEHRHSQRVSSTGESPGSGDRLAVSDQSHFRFKIGENLRNLRIDRLRFSPFASRRQQFVAHEGVGRGVLLRLRDSLDQQVAFVAHLVGFLFQLDPEQRVMNAVSRVLRSQVRY
jgi:hypothetical protein